MFVLMVREQIDEEFDNHQPIGVYDSQEAADKAADDLNKEGRKACYFYVQHVYFNKYGRRFCND